MNLFNRNQNPVKKQQAEYEKLRKDAMLAQRAGDIVQSAELHEKADELLARIEAARST